MDIKIPFGELLEELDSDLTYKIEQTKEYKERAEQHELSSRCYDAVYRDELIQEIKLFCIKALVEYITPIALDKGLEKYKRGY
jgi:hypothetical protein